MTRDIYLWLLLYICCDRLAIAFLTVFLKNTATTEIYPYCHTLSQHDAVPISAPPGLAWRVARVHRRRLVATGTLHRLDVRTDADPGQGRPLLGGLERLPPGAPYRRRRRALRPLHPAERLTEEFQHGARKRVV